MSEFKSGKPKGKGTGKSAGERKGGFGGPKRFGAGPGGPRGERGERSGGFGFRKGPPRGPRAEGGEGGEGGFRRPRRDFGDRPPRRDDAPRGEFRGPRGPRREEGEGRFERGPRREEGERFERGPRFDRERGPRPTGEGPRFPKGERPARAPRAEGDDSFFERPHVEKGEIYYHGRNACWALFKLRPQDIIRVYVKKGLETEFKELLNFCAAQRLAYHVVTENDLERITDTKHHDGISVLAREKRFLNEKDFYKEIGGGRTLVLYLDGVGNPHNLGAILRTASHFGVRYVAGEAEELPRISPAANRTSEGGSEHVNLVRVEEPEGFFDRLKKQGFQVYAFDPAATAISLFDLTLNEKAVFVMGAEVEGLSGLAKSSADVLVRIPGSGAVESLNVSVAASLAMAEFSRQQMGPRNVRIVKKRT